MRKLLLFLFIIALVYACGNNTSNADTTKQDSATKKDTAAKDTSNPNAPAATNAQY